MNDITLCIAHLFAETVEQRHLKIFKLNCSSEFFKKHFCVGLQIIATSGDRHHQQI